MLSIQWNGERLELHAQRAVHWLARRTLIIADPHFGKAASFRAAGVPVPGGTTQANLSQLSLLLQVTEAERVIVLGDLFHAANGRADQTFNAIEAWRRSHPALTIVNVRGNHDRHAGDPPAQWNITCADEPFIDEPFRFVHDPNSSAGGSGARRRPPKDAAPAFAGHLHPCARLIDVDGSSVRSACYWFGPHIAVLPAFGWFTGAHPIMARTGDRVFAISDSAVFEVATHPARR